MGKLNMGILGGFSGTVGTVVGSTNKKGEDIIRAKSKKSRPASSKEQVSQQAKFGAVTRVMRGVNPVLKTGLKNTAAAENISPYNYACRHALKNAITGTDENPEIDYSKLLLSDGILSRIPDATAVMSNGLANFSWSDAVDNCRGELSDYVCLVVYNVSNGELSFSDGENTRAAKTASVTLPYNSVGDTLLFYLFFRSATNALLVSGSQYLGSGIVE